MTDTTQDQTFNERQIISQLGTRLKERRIEMDMTISKLAHKANLSESLISQIERGIGNPAFVTLIKLTQALELETSEMFSSGDPSAAVVINPDKRLKMKVPGRGVFTERLTPENFFDFTILYAQYKPNSKEEQPYSHPGGESLVVLGGIFEFHYGKRTYLLNEGDTINFRGEIPHWGRNPGDATATLMMIIEDR
jgi:transcriptional regulator with XRE-family HTH domain